MTILLLLNVVSLIYFFKNCLKSKIRISCDCLKSTACFNQDTYSCCSQLTLNGNGAGKELNGQAFGEYQYHSMSNGHNVYKHIEDKWYLFFNSVNHWMVRKNE